MNDVTRILSAIEQGDTKATGELLPLVYQELRRIAAHKMAGEASGHTLQATALVHEAWLRLVDDGDRNWENRAHFFGAAAEAMRRILIENARRKSRLKRGGGHVRVDFDEIELAGTTADDKVLLIDEALERLKTEDPDTARVVVLKFFGGLTNEEIVAITGTSDRTVRRQWIYAKAWLYKSIRAQV
jgi:RNA polymerase sigma factor (TIGR02999 family)